MRLRKASIVFLTIHALTALFSLGGTWALYNLSQVPDWDYTIVTFWLGISNIITGVLTALLLMAHHEGWKAALTLLALCVLLAGGMELLGTTTGFPFGAYTYTDLLGAKFLGHVPYLIPPSWMMMLYPSMVLAHLLIPRGWLRPVAAGFILTIWDFAMDPAMTTGFAYWQWHTEGGFYGMPYVNWLGWWLTGTLVAAVFWKTCREWQGRWDPLVVLLYLVQGAFVALLAWLYMRPLATALWACAVLLLLIAVWHKRRSALLIPRGHTQWRTSS
jgi:putative membrane protein